MPTVGTRRTPLAGSISFGLSPATSSSGCSQLGFHDAIGIGDQAHCGFDTARKRKSSEVEPQAAAMPDMANAEDMRRQYHELCRAARLNIAIDSSRSPIPGRHEKVDKIWPAYQFLFMKNPRQLQQEVDNYQTTLASRSLDYQLHGARLDLLLDCLRNVAKAVVHAPLEDSILQRSPKRQPLTPVMQFEATLNFAQLKLPKGFDDLPAPCCAVGGAAPSSDWPYIIDQYGFQVATQKFANTVRPCKQSGKAIREGLRY